MPGSFKKFELLGKVKKLRDEGYFNRLIKDGCYKIEELILDSMLK